MPLPASRRLLILAATGVVLAGGGFGPALSAPAPARAHAPKFEEDKVLLEVIAGPWRPAADTARDRYRHPLESLTFWGLQPGLTVVDLQPGGGYWTQILAPYAARTGGRYIAGVADLENPQLSEGGRKGRDAFAARFKDTAIYGTITLVNFGPTSKPFAPPESVDIVLSSRELHNWASGNGLEKIMGDAFAALKPGGVFAVEDHRADPGPEAPNLASGYISTKRVVDAALKVGFRLDAASEVNANPADVKNYPFGVWTLPPSRQSSASGAPDPGFDHTKYDAIGESDRMTLRFRKPA